MVKSPWQVVYTKQAQRDAKKITQSGHRKKVKLLIEIIRENPYKTTPQYEKLVGDLKGAYSRRINFQHRLVYQVLEDLKTIKIIRMWTHHE